MWVPITEQSILSKLASPELNALRTAATAPGQGDPLGEVIAQVTREVRGHVAACKANPGAGYYTKDQVDQLFADVVTPAGGQYSLNGANTGITQTIGCHSPELLRAVPIRRPPSHAASNPAYTGDAVTGTRILHATPGSTSYDLLDDLDAWAASARLTAALPAASDTAEVIEASLIFDADNLDLALYESQSPAQQSNNALLLVVENEILSVGTITPDSQNPLRRTLTLLRGRLGTKAVQHPANAEAWLIEGDELTPLSHADYLPDTDRNFKLLPYTAAALLPAENAGAIPFHFAALPASNEAPEIVFGTMQTSVPAGASLTVPATVTAKDADIKTLQATLIALDAHGTDGPGQTLLASSAREDQRAFWPLSLLATCPVPGDYVVEIRVTNLAGVEFAERSPVITAGEPLPNYSWGEFLPTLGSATEVYTYTTRNGRWDTDSTPASC